MAVSELELERPLLHEDLSLPAARARGLVEAHQAGDPDAFPELVGMFYGPLLGQARHRLVDHGAAEDAVQETFLRAYRGLGVFGGDYYVGAWLYRILANVCADEGNRRQKEFLATERWSAIIDVSAAPIDETVERAEAIVRVANAVAALPERYREALVLRDFMELDYADVAIKAGITEENARARVHRARAALRRVLSAPSGMAGFMFAGVRRLGRFGLGAVHQIQQTAPTATTISPDTLTMSMKVGMAASTAAAAAIAVVAVVPQGSSAPPPAPLPPLPPVVRQAPPVWTRPLVAAQAPPAKVVAPPSTPPTTAAPIPPAAPAVKAKPKLIVLPKVVQPPVFVPIDAGPTLPVGVVDNPHGPKAPILSPVVLTGTLSSDGVTVQQGANGPVIVGAASLLSTSGDLTGQLTVAGFGGPLLAATGCSAPSTSTLEFKLVSPTGTVLDEVGQVTLVRSVANGAGLIEQFQGYVLPSANYVASPSGPMSFTGSLSLDGAGKGALAVTLGSRPTQGFACTPPTPAAPRGSTPVSGIKP